MNRGSSLLVILSILLDVEGAVAQEGCEFGNEGNDVVTSQTLPSIGRVTYITRPHFICAGGVQIWADSSVAYANQGMSHLIGTVRYAESSREMTADEARYFSNEGRLQAEGHVTVRDDGEGSSIRNGDLIYLLQTDFRDQRSMTVTTGSDGLRPVAVLTPPADSADGPNGSDSAGVPSRASPYTVVGDRIFLWGSGYFTASGTVEIVRDSLFAFADSAEFDQAERGLVLEGAARVEGSTYELEGRTITMGAPGSAENEVRAVRDARLSGQDVLLTAARISVFLIDGALQRLVATPLSRSEVSEFDSIAAPRPKAVVQNFVLTADSIEVRAPNEAVERVLAAGSARSVSTSRDSVNVDVLPEIARSDWLEGDTVIVNFRGAPEGRSIDAPPEDGTRDELVVETIVALINARSLYRLPPSDSTARVGTDPPAVHYVLGNQITIEMNQGEVVGMRVVGQTRGVHLEPLKPNVTAADSALASDSTLVLDTASVAAPDTGAVYRLDPFDGTNGTGHAPAQPYQQRYPVGVDRPWTRP